MQETLRAIDDLIRSGKVLYAGMSEWTASQMADALATADRYLLDRIVVSQPIYNMFERYIEKEVIPYGEKNGIGQVVFSPLAQGLLTGKYRVRGGIPADSRANKLEWMRKGITEEKLAKVRALSGIASELEISPWASWPWPGFSASRTSRARSSAPAVRSRSWRTSRRSM